VSSAQASLWGLDATVTHLNHGSFGATPRAVLERQAEWRSRMEANPVRFFGRQLPELLDAAREQLARFVGADAAGLAFVPNASTGINAVLRSLSIRHGDEIVVTDHAYGAARNAVDFVATRAGAVVVVAPIRMPLAGPEAVTDAVLAAVTPRTRLAVIDHVTSSTAIVYPIREIVAALEAQGVPALVDGAHAPGMLDLDVTATGAAYYTGNCHKWLCAPKGAAFLWVRDDVRPGVVPVVAGWGRTQVPQGRSQYHAEFDWVGTDDPSAYLCVPQALATMGTVFAGGWQELRTRNRTLALAGRDLLLEVLETTSPAPDEMLGSMAIVPLPAAPRPPNALELDPLQTYLAEEWSIEVPVTRGPGPDDRWLRVSAQAYNSRDEYERLATAVGEWTGRRFRG